MDVARLVTGSTLQTECPHCGNVETDEYESLDGDVLLDLRCVNCSQTFFIAVMQCEGCAGESLFGWMRRPTSDRFEDLSCAACSRPYRDHEAATARADLRE